MGVNLEVIGVNFEIVLNLGLNPEIIGVNLEITGVNLEIVF